MVVDHIGYAVKDIQKAKAEFESFGYVFDKLVEDYDRNLFIMFGSNEEVRIELLQTMNSEQESPVEGIIKKNGPTPYHICYQTDDIEAEIARLKSRKWIVVVPPAKAVAFDKNGNVQVAFLMHRAIGMIELVAYMKENT